MKTMHRHFGKLAIKHDQIVSDLRGQILRGEIAPGHRLPTRSDLIDQYGVSSVTIQRAFDRLILDGFVYSRGSRGTFVCPTPPHLFTYGTLFPVSRPEELEDSRFWLAMRQSSQQIAHQRKAVTFRSYFGAANEDMRETCIADVKANRMAGLILLSPGFDYAGTPVREQAGMPRVFISPVLVDSYSRPAGSVLVALDISSLYRRALEHLSARKRQRLAIFGMGTGWTSRDKLMDMVRQSGLSIDPAHVLEFHPHLPQAARHVTQLLMRLPADSRPDSIFITDDNLVEAVTEGLKAEGIATGTTVDVVAHCNYPVPPPAAVPVTYLGFDCFSILRQAVELVDAMRAGKKDLPDTVSVSAVFENELASHK